MYISYLCTGNTALHYAASGGFVDVARELILAGAKVEEPNENGHTPLMEAATAGQVEVAALLLSKGARINTHSTEFKESALTLACYKGWFMWKICYVTFVFNFHAVSNVYLACYPSSMNEIFNTQNIVYDHCCCLKVTESFPM